MTMSDPGLPPPAEEGTRLAGEAYRSRAGLDRTRVAGEGYESMLASRLGLAPPEARAERYGIGDRIGGRYEVLAIHRGALGVVYGTFDHDTRLPRALKTLQSRFGKDERIRNLFVEEATVWLRLEKHPFIVRAYLVESFDRQPYVITEYIRGLEGMGSDLRSWLGHPRLTLAVAVEMALQIAQAMQHAVRKVPDLVHRDLKPANVLVDHRGRPMVTDFGLVYAADRDAGTPAYMAPEQWRGKTLDARTDIYAYGCIVYEMLTGHRIFRARSLDEWKAAHLEQMPVSPRALIPELSSEVSDFVISCLAKAPSARPGCWDEVVSACAAWFHRLTGQAAVLDFGAYELTIDELVPASYSLFTLKRYEEAIAVCDRALAIDSSQPFVLNNRGAALLVLKRLEEALSAYDHALQLHPSYVDAWNGKGNVLHELNRLDEALSAHDRALQLDPSYASTWTNKGNVLDDLKRPDEALSAYDRALQLDPSLAAAWCNKGFALHKLTRLDEALSAYDRALQLDLSYALAWHNKGVLLHGLNRFDEALSACDRALHLDPSYAFAWQNKANVLQSLKRFEEAIAAYDRALAISANLADAWIGRGATLWYLGRFDDSIAACDRALSLDPGNALALANKDMALKARGQ